MTDLSRRTFIASAAALTACGQEFQTGDAPRETFVCPPCGCSADTIEFAAPGRCPACDMTLMPKHESVLGFEPTALITRAGSFDISGGINKENRPVTLHYYLPDGLTREADILLVIPGAGRNAFQYRNEWLDFARRRKTLVAALEYPEDTYDFAAYHMGGVVKNLSFDNADVKTPGVIRLDDDAIKFDVNPNKDEWLFKDFDRIFGYLKKAAGLATTEYDIFGHSAGGQILHRMALFYPEASARRIIAANAGWYTLPTFDQRLPAGLQGSLLERNHLVRSFASSLTLLLGEDDDSDQAGGTLLHTPVIDQQGLGRLSRGKHFYKIGKEEAAKFGDAFRWRLETVANVGHDFREMSKAAALTLAR